MVILILGILTTLVVLSVSGITSKAETTACEAHRRTLEQAGEAYFAQTPAETIPATGIDEPYEQTLVERGFLLHTSQYYDLDADGQIVTVAGSPCPV